MSTGGDNTSGGLPDWDAHRALLEMRVEESHAELQAVKRRNAPMFAACAALMIALLTPWPAGAVGMVLISIALVIVAVRRSMPDLRAQVRRHDQLRAGATHLWDDRGDGKVRMRPVPAHWSRRPAAQILLILSVPACLAGTLVSRVLPMPPEMKLGFILAGLLLGAAGIVVNAAAARQGARERRRNQQWLDDRIRASGIDPERIRAVVDAELKAEKQASRKRRAPWLRFLRRR